MSGEKIHLYDDDAFIGEIRLFSTALRPNRYPWNENYWTRCDGRMFCAAQNTALFSLLGTKYGGNGFSTFHLPDLRGKQPDPRFVFCIGMQGIYPRMDNPDLAGYLGQIRVFAKEQIPSVFELCEGQTLAIAENPDLFKMLGTRFGGDGKTTFAVPDLRGSLEDWTDRVYAISVQGPLPDHLPELLG